MEGHVFINNRGSGDDILALQSQIALGNQTTGASIVTHTVPAGRKVKLIQAMMAQSAYGATYPVDYVCEYQNESGQWIVLGSGTSPAMPSGNLVLHIVDFNNNDFPETIQAIRVSVQRAALDKRAGINYFYFES